MDLGQAEYSEAVRLLLKPKRQMDLGPGTPQLERRTTLAKLTAEALFAGQPLSNPKSAQCCLAALWLYHDFLDEAHRISQEIATREGSYWHGIMHRREPDAWNSKYWFRRVGDHPVMSQLTLEAGQIGYAYRSPFDFIDDCERYRGTRSEKEMLLQQVQMVEWRLLFDHCWRQAVGDTILNR